ncbi:hypothetical protein BPO_1442 [Bergeyella porcorum]|uniref:Uncharacterized protein n=1 Tax=Bergeyella porcorum TaxID=1735111 RepID=A0AAU0F2C1_9FLAO
MVGDFIVGIILYIAGEVRMEKKVDARLAITINAANIPTPMRIFFVILFIHLLLRLQR